MDKTIEYKLLEISSVAFKDGDKIPLRYTCDGINISPALDIKNIPEATRSLALIVDDPDAPTGTWVHWVVWNIPVTNHIKENEIQGIEGINDFKQHHYGGPCPPTGTHRYFFKVYALDSLIDLPVNSEKLHLENAISKHIIAFGEMVGLYKRNN